MNITDKQSEYVDEVVKLFKDQGIRASKDLRNEKIGFKIREHTLRRVPYLLVVGDQEMENREVAVRTRDGVDLGKIKIDQFAAMVKEQISLRSLNLLEE